MVLLSSPKHVFSFKQEPPPHSNTSRTYTLNFSWKGILQWHSSLSQQLLGNIASATAMQRFTEPSISQPFPLSQKWWQTPAFEPCERKSVQGLPQREGKCVGHQKESVPSASSILTLGRYAGKRAELFGDTTRPEQDTGSSFVTSRKGTAACAEAPQWAPSSACTPPSLSRAAIEVMFSMTMTFCPLLCGTPCSKHLKL